MTVFQSKLADLVAARDKLLRAMPRNADALALGQAVDAVVKTAPIDPETIKGMAKGDRFYREAEAAPAAAAPKKKRGRKT